MTASSNLQAANPIADSPP
jgi:hypothetical protein